MLQNNIKEKLVFFFINLIWVRFTHRRSIGQWIYSTVLSTQSASVYWLPLRFRKFHLRNRNEYPPNCSHPSINPMAPPPDIFCEGGHRSQLVERGPWLAMRIVNYTFEISAIFYCYVVNAWTNRMACNCLSLLIRCSLLNVKLNRPPACCLNFFGYEVIEYCKVKLV